VFRNCAICRLRNNSFHCFQREKREEDRGSRGTKEIKETRVVKDGNKTVSSLNIKGSLQVIVDNALYLGNICRSASKPNKY